MRPALCTARRKTAAFTASARFLSWHYRMASGQRRLSTTLLEGPAGATPTLEWCWTLLEIFLEQPTLEAATSPGWFINSRRLPEFGTTRRYTPSAEGRTEEIRSAP